MSKPLIQKYYKQLHEVLNADGTRNETSVSFAFANFFACLSGKEKSLLVEQKEAKGRDDCRTL